MRRVKVIKRPGVMAQVSGEAFHLEVSAWLQPKP